MEHRGSERGMIRLCPSCRGNRSARRFVKGGWEVRACRACGTWFVANPPRAEDLRGIYGEAYFTERLAQHRADALRAAAWRAAVANGRRRLALIRRHAPRARRLLDVGCGTGAFLSVARDAYDCRGVDVSPEAAAVVRQRLGVTCHAGDLSALAPSLGQCDVVTMFDVIEHVADPSDVLATAVRMLTPRGIVVLTTGDVDSAIARMSGRWWHLMTPPEHLTFFSRTGLAQMAERCGLAVEHVSHRPVIANVGYIAAKLAGVVGRPLGWLPRCVGALGLDGVDVDVNVLDVVTLVARRA